jgi:hypothetical protein
MTVGYEQLSDLEIESEPELQSHQMITELQKN